MNGWLLSTRDRINITDLTLPRNAALESKQRRKADVSCCVQTTPPSPNVCASANVCWTPMGWKGKWPTASSTKPKRTAVLRIMRLPGGVARWLHLEAELTLVFLLAASHGRWHLIFLKNNTPPPPNKSITIPPRIFFQLLALLTARAELHNQEGSSCGEKAGGLRQHECGSAASSEQHRYHRVLLPHTSIKYTWNHNITVISTYCLPTSAAIRLALLAEKI